MKSFAILVVVGLLVLSPAFAGGAREDSSDGTVTLTVWHDLGDKGVEWFDEMASVYQQENPHVSVESVTYPTQQWIERSIAAINTNTAPDIIFNNYERVIRVEDQTGNMLDLSDAFNSVDGTSFLSEQDLTISRYGGKMLIFPIQRVQMAFGVRSSWLDKVGMDFPATWDEAIAVAEAFQTGDPDGDGVNGNTYGFALQAANPRDLIHMLDLFLFGSGIKHTIIEPNGELVLDGDRYREVVRNVIEAYREYSPSDTINFSFTEMYQVIEGGRAGMFRVGDWNVNKWDQADVLDGDFEIGPWPAQRSGDANAVVIGGMRGAAIPENAPHREEAVKFAQFMLEKEPQRLSFRHVGASVRGDWELDLREHQRYFAQPQHNLIAYDFPESVHSFYPQIEEIYHRHLLRLLDDRSLDVDQVIDEAIVDIERYISRNS
jgi:multiple sugar transport system substrate-binding protein